MGIRLEAKRRIWGSFGRCQMLCQLLCMLRMHKRDFSIWPIVNILHFEVFWLKNAIWKGDLFKLTLTLTTLKQLTTICVCNEKIKVLSGGPIVNSSPLWHRWNTFTNQQYLITSICNYPFCRQVAIAAYM